VEPSLIATSSAPGARAQSIEFLELLSLGPEILPLLMEKLTDPEQFFALVAVDRLIRRELQVIRDWMMRLCSWASIAAIDTVLRWIQTEA